MITAATLTNGSFTLILDNGAQILTATDSHPKWEEIIEAYKAEDEGRLRILLSMKKVFEEYSEGGLVIDGTGITYHGRPMHGIDVDRALAFLKQGLPYKPYANYLRRKMKNSSARSIEEMYKFLEHKHMPLTPSGKFIAYKGVAENYYSIMGNTSTVVLQGVTDPTGHILNVVGETIEVERSSVDDNFNNGCSFGLHAGSLVYAHGWGKRVVLVEIDPADVVSVPDCSSHQKLRCCKYKVIGDFIGRLPDTYTNEFSSNSDDESSEDDDDKLDCCPQCGEVECMCDEDVCYNCDELESECTCDDQFDDSDNQYCYDCESTNCTCEDENAIKSNVGVVSSHPKSDSGFGSSNKVDEDKSNPGSCPNCAAFYEYCVCGDSHKKKNPPENDSIKDALISLLVDEGIAPDRIFMNSTPESLGMDSLDIVELQMTVENDWGLTIPDEEWYGLETFGAMSEYIGKKINGGIDNAYEDLETLISNFLGDTSTKKSETVPAPVSQKNYLQGLKDGVADRAKNTGATYLAGDQLGADSNEFASFIDGYVYGYNN